MGRPGRSLVGEACPSPQEPTDPSELGGPSGLAGLLKSHWAAGGNGPDSLTSRRDFKTQERFQDPGDPRPVLLAGNSSIHVLHDQHRRLVGIVVSLPDHRQRPMVERNHMA